MKANIDFFALRRWVRYRPLSLSLSLSVIHYGAPIYLTLINSLVVPQLAKASSERSGLPTSWLLLVSRLLTTWVVPGLVVVFLDNSCGQHWVNFWDACGSAESIAQMDVHGPDGGIVNDQYGYPLYWSNTTYVDARSEICLASNSATGKAYLRTNTPQCARAIVAALTPLLLKKMAIAALALPAITVLKWRALPRGVWARLRCKSNARISTTDIALDNVVAQCLTWLDVAWQVRFVFLSATVPNGREFARWVAATHGQPCHLVTTAHRPTPLQHWVHPVPLH